MFVIPLQKKLRPDLHEFLLAKISPQKLTTGKRVIDISESATEVVVTCMDETTYVGHLVIGADGAYSAIRQLMYEKLKANGELPESDKRPLYFDKQCVVGKSTAQFNSICLREVFRCIHVHIHRILNMPMYIPVLLLSSPPKGMTCPLDPKKYPVLQDESCEVKVLLGKDQHTSVSISVPFLDAMDGRTKIFNRATIG